MIYFQCDLFPRVIYFPRNLFLCINIDLIISLFLFVVHYHLSRFSLLIYRIMSHITNHMNDINSLYRKLRDSYYKIKIFREKEFIKFAQNIGHEFKSKWDTKVRYNSDDLITFTCDEMEISFTIEDDLRYYIIIRNVKNYKIISLYLGYESYSDSAKVLVKLLTKLPQTLTDYIYNIEGSEFYMFKKILYQ